MMTADRLSNSSMATESNSTSNKKSSNSHNSTRTSRSMSMGQLGQSDNTSSLPQPTASNINPQRKRKTITFINSTVESIHKYINDKSKTKTTKMTKAQAQYLDGLFATNPQLQLTTAFKRELSSTLNLSTRAIQEWFNGRAKNTIGIYDYSSMQDKEEQQKTAPIPVQTAQMHSFESAEANLLFQGDSGSLKSLKFIGRAVTPPHTPIPPELHRMSSRSSLFDNTNTLPDHHPTFYVQKQGINNNFETLAAPPSPIWLANPTELDQQFQNWTCDGMMDLAQEGFDSAAALPEYYDSHLKHHENYSTNEEKDILEQFLNMHDTSDLILDDLGADTANTFPVDYLDNRRRSFSDTAALTGRCLGNDMDAMLVDVLRGPSPDGLDDTERTQF